MSWTLEITPPGEAAIAYRSTDPAAVDGGFKWQLHPSGMTIQLDFSALPSVMPIPAFSTVLLLADGFTGFYGVVLDPPSPFHPDTVTVTVLSGREFLERTLMDGTVYRNQGVYQIVRDVLARLAPPTLVTNDSLVGDPNAGLTPGPALDLYYAPTKTLAGVLDELAASAGTTWGVDRSGWVRFGQPGGTLVIDYATQGRNWQRLTVQGRETVSQAVLRVVTAPSEGVLSASTYHAATDTRTAYLPATISVTATAPEHVRYHAAASVPVPDGLSALRESRVASVTASGMQHPELVLDTTPGTSSVSTDARPSVALSGGEGRVVGARLRYSLTLAEGAFARIQVGHAAGEQVASEVFFDLPASTERELIVVAPPSAEVIAAGWSLSRIAAYVLASSDGPELSALSISEFVLLVVDEAVAGNIASSFLQLPFTQPSEVVLDSFVPPQPTVTVINSPDGTVSGPAGLYQYEHLPDGTTTTRVRIGTTGTNPAVRALRFSVKP